MKTYKYLFSVIILGFAVSSCQDLDLKPKGIFDEGTLFASDYGIRSYFAVLYNRLPIEDFNYYNRSSNDQGGYASIGNIDHNDGWGNGIGNFWEGQKNSLSTAAGETSGREGSNEGVFQYWPFVEIRLINNFIAEIPNYSNIYSQDEINAYIGEVRFFRAYYYFGMVKRYGGVPIIEEVQDPTAPLEDLQIPRSTEYECWKFIYNDLKFAMENMQAKSVPGRANRYTAAALMSRTMLFAAAAANYGGHVLPTGPAVSAGLMGIPQDKAAEFYQYVLNACEFIKAGGYRLHNGANKETACLEAMIEDLNGEEDIFVKQYGQPDNQATYNARLRHSWDTMVLPLGTGLAQSVGCAIQGAWDILKLYELPTLIDENRKPVRFNNLNELWQSPNMEPRVRANFYFSGMTETVSGTVFDVQAGVYTSFPGTYDDATAEDQTNAYMEQYRIRAQRPGETQTIGGQQVKVNGANGLAMGTGDEGYTNSCIIIRKYVNYKDVPANRVLYRSTQSFKVFRYAEILLNRAEAAYELGLLTGNEALKAEAFTYVNEVRERAGAHPHQPVANPADVSQDPFVSVFAVYPIDENLQYIRDERSRELCLENIRFWDLRRWRVSHTKFDGSHFPRGLMGYYVLDEGKYIFLNDREKENRSVNFQRKNYYWQIPGAQIERNPSLIRNDGH